MTDKDGCSEPQGLGHTTERSKSTGAPLVRRGLCLEGGGAKGAYALGVVKCLQENGYHFDCVAGTSVGALNAAIVATDRVQQGIALWKEINEATSISLRRPVWLYVALGALNAALQWARARVTREVVSARTSKVVEGVHFGLVMSLVMFVYGSLFLMAPLFAGAGLNMTALAVVLLSAALLTVHWLILDGPSMLDRWGLTAFDATPLRNTIRSALNDATFRMPCYATTARSRLVYDPRELKWVLIPPHRYRKNEVEPEFFSRACATYERCDRMSNAELVETLAASAALPMGLMPNVGERIDGGVADNRPIYPLIEYERCDEIFVVLLRPLTAEEASDVEAAFRDHWLNHDYEQRAAKLSKVDAILLSGGIEKGKSRYPNPLKAQPPPTWPRFYVFAPPIPLGGIKSGLLNFDPVYADQLINFGFEETRRTLQKFKPLSESRTF